MQFFVPLAPAKHFFSRYLRHYPKSLSDAEHADFLVLPFMYEVIYDYADWELEKAGVAQTDVTAMKALAVELDELSVSLQKKLIVFFYRDPDVELPFRNALIFRTSGFQYKVDGQTFGMPAFLSPISGNKDWAIRKKGDKPRVSFRGKAAPLSLPTGIKIRQTLNQVLKTLPVANKVKNFQPEGYLFRRKAMLSCMKAGASMETDFVVNPEWRAGKYKEEYLASFADNDYFICCAGFGNYSFRLYEVMQEGRIPVIIDTDALMPVWDVEVWKEFCVWVPQKEVAKTADHILDFHARLTPLGYESLQIQIKESYQDYLTEEGFANYLIQQLLREWKST